ALDEVLGVDYRGTVPVTPVSEQDIDVNFAKSLTAEYWEKRKQVFDFRQDVESFLNTGKMPIYVGSEPVTLKGPALRVAPKDNVKAIATIRGKSAKALEFPAVITHIHGQGRVVYLAAGTDAAYYLYPYPYQRLVLKHAILWSAGTPPPMEVAAPMCVHSTLMRQPRPEGDRLIVHLF